MFLKLRIMVMMKSIFASLVLFICTMNISACAPSGSESDGKGPQVTPAVVRSLGYKGKAVKSAKGDVWTLKGGVTIYSTYPYGKKITGFAGPTPLFIAVDRNGHITGMAAAPNAETPDIFKRALPLLKAWNGLTLKQAAGHTPDAVTGATFSSRAIIGTVHAAAKKIAK